MALDRINEGYIRTHYDIDKERGTVEYLDQVDRWCPTDYDGMTIREVKQEVATFFNSLEDTDILDIEYWGHDGSYDLLVKRKTTRRENDQEVIKRLMKVEREKRKRQKAIADAAELLRQNGMKVESDG